MKLSRLGRLTALAAGVVDKLAAGQTGSVTVTFKSQGDWLLDDVIIDPYRRG